MQRGEGGWEATATAASMHRCSLLNVSISPSPLSPPHPLPLHLTFLFLMQCKYITTRWHLSYRKVYCGVDSSYEQERVTHCNCSGLQS